MRRAAVGVLAGTLAFSGAALGVGVTPANAVEGFEFDRLAGENRYGTAADIARDGWGTNAPTVILASGAVRNFPDALTGNYLAGEFQAPILLTPPGVLARETRDALEDLNTTRVIIVGETSAVSAAVEAQVDAIVDDVDRLGGPDRYDTAEEVALFVGDTDTTNVGEDPEARKTAVLGNGQNFPDILAAGPLGYAEQFPITITPNTRATLEPETKNVLESLDIEHVVIVGGPAAVPASVENDVEAMGIEVTRLGADRGGRYETAELIANFAWDELGFDETHVNLARSDDFADALAGGPHAGEDLAPILITLPNDLVIATERVLEARRCTLEDGHIFGGPVAISLAVQAEAEAVAGNGEGCGEPAPGEAAALSLTPETAINPEGTDHSVTATLTDAEGNAPADGDLVRFEVYGEPDEDFTTGGGTRDARFFETGGVVTADNGTATFTYEDNESASQEMDPDNQVAEDYIISCIVETASDNCLEEQPVFGGVENYLVVDRVTGEPLNIDREPSDYATKDWEQREAAALNLTPANDTNVFGDVHEVTATVLDQFGDPFEGSTVNFEVYRNLDDEAEGDADTGYTLVETGSDDTEQEGENTSSNPNDDEAPGEATFEYSYGTATGEDDDVEANDTIVACIENFVDDEDGGLEDGDGDSRCAALDEDLDAETDADDTNDVVLDETDDFIDTAAKSWVEAVFTIASLTPADATNPVGTFHTVTATVVDQFGDAPLEGNEQEVTFEVYSEDADGDFTAEEEGADTTGDDLANDGEEVDEETAEGDENEAYYSYTSDEERQDTIVACVDDDPNLLDIADGCATIDDDGSLELDEDNDVNTAQKTWVALDETPADGTYAGEVIGEPVEGGTDDGGAFNLFTGEEFITVTYDEDDLFRINGTAVNEARFEQSLSNGDSVTVTLDPDRNTLNITTDVEPDGVA